MPIRQGEFWSERKVAWYRRALAGSDYADRVLGALEPVLAGSESALDVGAGCGALALPLARRLARVTALEPAPAMARALRAEARARRLGNVEVVEATWSDRGPLPPHDVVLCAHVGHLLRPGAPFLHEVSAAARRWVVLVRDVRTDGDKFFFRELYPLLLGRPYVSGCDYEETVDGLAALGVSPTVRVVDYRSDQPFDSLEEACDFYEEYLGVSGADARRTLAGLLATRLRRDGAAWVAPYTKRAAVIVWPVTGIDRREGGAACARDSSTTRLRSASTGN